MSFCSSAHCTRTTAEHHCEESCIACAGSGFSVCVSPSRMTEQLSRFADTHGMGRSLCGTEVHKTRQLLFGVVSLCAAWACVQVGARLQAMEQFARRELDHPKKPASPTYQPYLSTHLHLPPHDHFLKRICICCRDMSFAAENCHPRVF
eukprot:2114779-Pleurochrysis_carterae.AAC.1